MALEIGRRDEILRESDRVNYMYAVGASRSRPNLGIQIRIVPINFGLRPKFVVRYLL